MTKMNNSYCIVVDKKSNTLIWFWHGLPGVGNYEIPLVFTSKRKARDYLKQSDDFSLEDIGAKGEWKLEMVSKSQLSNYF